MYQIIFYWDERGRKPVREFIDLLPDKTQNKIEVWIDLLKKDGPFLRRPYADKIDGKIYELRIRFSSDSIRILYFFFIQGKIVLLHAFRKKDWKIESGDLQIAKKRICVKLLD